MRVVWVVSVTASILLGPLHPLHAEQQPTSVCRLPTVPEGTVARIHWQLQNLAWPGWQSQCEALFDYVRPGKPPYTATARKRVERFLLATGYFQTVTCDLAKSNRQLRCRLTPKKIIADVSIVGELPWPLLKSDVRRRVFLRTGSILESPDEQLAEQKQRLRDYFTRLGYFQTQVALELAPTKGSAPNQGVHLYVRVEPGFTTTVGRVQVRNGNILSKDFFVDRVSHRGFLWLYPERFQPQRFEEDWQAITKALQERGWPAARVRGTYTLREAAGKADLRLQVELGPKLTLRFLGNRTIDDDDLAAVATFREAGAVDSLEFENTADNIVTTYQSEGYYAPEVSWRAQDVEEGLVLTYDIQEGPRADVSQVRFVGNDAFTAETLLEDNDLFTKPPGVFSETRWVTELAERDARALERFYAQRGYPDASVEAERLQAPDDGRLVARFLIEEGQPRRVTTITFAGLPAAIDENAVRKALVLEDGAPFVPEKLQEARQTVLSLLVARGYSDANVEAHTEVRRGPDAEQVRIRFVVEPGTRATYGGVFIRGVFRTDPDVIRDQFDLPTGEPLDLALLSRAQTELRELGVFSSVTVDALPRPPGTRKTWLTVAVEESRRRRFDLVGSFGSDEFFSLGFDFIDRNVLGRALSLDVTLRFSNASEILSPSLRIGNYDQISVRLGAPKPLGLPFDVATNAFYQFYEQRELFDRNAEPLFSERRFGAGLAARKDVLVPASCPGCPLVQGTLGYELLSSRFQLNVDPEDVPQAPFLPETTEDRAIGRIFTEWLVDDRVTPVEPRSGYFSRARFDVAVPALAFSVEDATGFWRGIIRLDGFLNLGVPFTFGLNDTVGFGGPFVLALSGTFGYADNLNVGASIPLAEAFAFGGTQSVRGVEFRASTNAFPRATVLGIARAEARWYLVRNLGIGDIQLAAFSDLGTVGYALDELASEPTVAVGPAIRYVTPVGPLSLAYGWPVVRSPTLVRVAPETIEPTGRLHVTLGYAF